MLTTRELKTAWEQEQYFELKLIRRSEVDQGEIAMHDVIAREDAGVPFLSERSRVPAQDQVVCVETTGISQEVYYRKYTG